MYNVQTTSPIHYHTRLLLRCSSTSNNLNQLSSNDSLSRSVVENLEFVDHVAGVLRSVIHGVTAGGDFAGVTLGEGPVERICQRVLAEVTENRIVNLEVGEIC